ncbi:MAG: DsrE family protein [Campylobacterales bacterium]|nr:DsrE family protein [Campylobacterales bacterium]
MKKLLFTLLLSLGLMSAAATAADKQSIFVNVTSSDNVKGPMAVMFANQGLMQGLDMTIFLNTEGVRLAVKGFNPPTNAQNGKNTHEMLSMFVKNGGKLLVCPMCLKAQGYDKSDLIPEAVLSDANKTFGGILSSDKVISF